MSRWRGPISKGRGHLDRLFRGGDIYEETNRRWSHVAQRKGGGTEYDLREQGHTRHLGTDKARGCRKLLATIKWSLTGAPRSSVLILPVALKPKNINWFRHYVIWRWNPADEKS